VFPSIFARRCGFESHRQRNFSRVSVYLQIRKKKMFQL